MVRKRILSLDIGSGTVDVLYYITADDGGPCAEPENLPKFVLPSPAQRIAARVRELTAAKRGFYLHGENMGGGFFRAVSAHLKAGLPAAVHPDSAWALSDDPARLESMGLKISTRPAPELIPVHTADYDPGYWRSLLAMCGLEPPDLILAAAQDHGYHPQGSNRLGRFELWRNLLAREGGRLEALFFEEAPEEMTRLRTLQRATGGGPVADTGAAAVLGALFDPQIADLSQQSGVMVVNAGNSHFLAFLVFRERIYGVYEHHTGMQAPEAIAADLDAFRRGTLANQDVLDSGGHGVHTLELPNEARTFSHVCVMGPRRRLADEALRDAAGSYASVLHPAPGGDMMIAGCFGLVRGYYMTRRV
ncbi:hypothetical protein DPQ33_10090 [Oceanidesulfovibrio indonesiensis]|uniref:DUF1786 domain-containing protein n=1 Tax=Oceanidesulfovibrio indonesiensis TaxID=54767 RepID=A0A7M3MFI6_9BACT|nr:hypothetical protein DPQ33_10090 [Oceanidesulfovibrio indonesiensis]